MERIRPLEAKLLCSLGVGLLTAFAVNACAQEAPPVVPAQPPLIDPVQIASERIDFANGLFQRGFYDMALAEYQSLAAEYPEHPKIEDIHLGWAESLFFLKKHKEALFKYRVFLLSFPQTSQRLISEVRIGQCWFFLRKYSKAQKVFADIDPAVLPEDQKLTRLFYYAQSAKSLRNYSKAKSLFEQMTDFPSEHQQVFLAFLEMADLDALLKNYESSMIHFDEAFAKADSREWKSRVLLKKGMAQFEFGKYPEALGTFQSLLEKFPDDVNSKQARSNLMLTLFHLGQHADVVAAYEAHKDIWQFAGEDAGIFKTILKSYASAGRSREGLALLESVMSSSEVSAERRKEWLLVKADLLLKAKDFESLQKLAVQGEADGVWSEDYKFFLEAEASYGRGDYEAALKQYEAVQEKFPQSEWLESVIYGRAFAYRQLGQTAEAVKWFEELYRIASDSQKKQDALDNIILTYSQVSDWGQAHGACERFLTEFPDAVISGRVAYLRGYFLFKNHEYGRSIEALQKFLEAYPQDSFKDHALFYIGFSHQSEGRMDEALRHYGMIDLNAAEPDLAASVMKSRTLLYLKTRQEQKAADEFHRMIEMVKAENLDPDLIFWLAEYDIAQKNYDGVIKLLENLKDVLTGENAIRANAFSGDIHRLKGDCEQAVTAYDAALRSDMDSPFKGLAYIGKADCLTQLQRYQDAADLLKMVSDKYRSDPFVVLRTKFASARLEEAQGRLESAAKLYMFAAILYKDERVVPEALFRAGQIFEILKKRMEAIKAYSEIIRDYSSSSYSAQAQERIKVLQ